MTLKLFDSMSRELRDFVPVVPGKAGIYICGLTTQAPPHPSLEEVNVLVTEPPG